MRKQEARSNQGSPIVPSTMIHSRPSTIRHASAYWPALQIGHRPALNMRSQQSKASLQPGPRKGCFRALLQLLLVASKKEDAGGGQANTREQPEQTARATP